MSPERQRLIRMLFEEYIELYAARDARLLGRFSSSFSGFSGSSDRLVRSREEWLSVTSQDFAQVPGRIGIEMVDFHAQEISDDVAAATAFFHIHLPVPDPVFARETARLVLVFRREDDDWKIVHSSVSIPYGTARQGDVFATDRLAEHNRELRQLVQEHTTALAHANDQLRQLSCTDALTGVANRRRFDQALAHEWARAQRAQLPLALIMLDVDGFKHFNDQYGHLAGDSCLQTLALTLAQTGGPRESDLVARFGGEEFVVLLPGADAAAAREVAERIQQAVVALALPHDGAPWGIVTVSFGVASMRPQREQAPAELVRRADRAMYRAKQAGRNRVEMAQD